MRTPTDYLKTELDQLIEQCRNQLQQKVAEWLEIEYPLSMLKLEQELMIMVGGLANQLVKIILSAIHLKSDLVIECQTQALACGLCNVDWRPVKIQTLFGQEIMIKTPYAKRKRSRRKLKKRGQGGSGDYPVLRRLGIIGRATPALLTLVNWQLASSSSEAEVEQRLAQRGIKLDSKTIRRYVRDFAGIALWQRQRNLDNFKPNPHPNLPLKDKRVVLAVDGGRLRTRVEKKGRRRASGRHGFYADWREPKLFVIYTINQEGRKEKSEVLYDGTLQKADECFELISWQLAHLAINQAQSLTILADGASWIWKRIPDLIRNLGSPQLPVVQILDFRHAFEKLITAVKASSYGSQARRSWITSVRKLLKKGKIKRIIEKLQELDQTHDTEGAIRRAINYCQKHHARMQYSDFSSQGLPTGSGAIESGIRRIVNLRLKGAGIFWKEANAERILLLRCQVKAGRWDYFVKSVLNQWACDFSVSLAQVNSTI